MGQYKVPQNVESEDKIVGPLSLKQLIYVLIGLAIIGLAWFTIADPTGNYILFGIIAFFFGGPLLALGFLNREEQSFENYLVAWIRFVVIPRKRIWLKQSIEDIVITDTQPEQITAQNQPELEKGQLAKLAMIVDTRGGTRKNSSIQIEDQASDQLAARVNGPIHQTGHAPEVFPGDDVLDLETHHQTGKLDQMLAVANQNRISNIERQLLNNNTDYQPETNHSPDLQQYIAKDALTVEQLSRQLNNG